MPYIHSLNKHNRKSFSISTDAPNDSDGNRFNVFIYRGDHNNYREYYPKHQSTMRIQQLLDSSLFRAEIEIELDGDARDTARKYRDYLDIEIIPR